LLNSRLCLLNQVTAGPEPSRNLKAIAALSSEVHYIKSEGWYRMRLPDSRRRLLFASAALALAMLAFDATDARAQVSTGSGPPGPGGPAGSGSR